MIDKIKGIMTVREDMDELKAEMGRLTAGMKKLGEHYAAEAARMRELHDTQSDMLATFLSATQNLGKLKDDVRKELEEFRMFHRQAQSKIMDKFQQEVSAVLTTNTKALELDKTNYEKVRGEVIRQGELLSQLNGEIAKLLLITKTLKAQDFALAEHHKKMLEEDQHKLKLMAQIDELEHMIAKMKQGRRDGPRQF